MQDLSDTELLRQYAESQSEAAFEILVTRHVNLVYSAALRKTGNFHAAEEVAQAVFIIFAKKAGALRKETIVSGWLYQTARLTAANFLRNEIRRVRREQEATMNPDPNEPALWPQIIPLLEDAMGRLNEQERNAVLLRFFEDKSFQEIGTALGGSENAAKKRVAYALEKLRKFFAKRGVSSTTAVIAAAISANSVHAAPASLTQSISAVAVAKGAAASTSTLTLVRGALKFMAWTKTKTAIAGVAIALLGIGGTTMVANALLPVPDIQGTWECTFNLSGWGVHNRESPKTRFVLTVTETNGGYQAKMDDLDRGHKNIGFETFTYKYPYVHATIGEFGESGVAEVNRSGQKMSWQVHDSNDVYSMVFMRTTNPPSFPEALTDAEFAPRAGSALQGFWVGMIGRGKNAIHIQIKIAEAPDGTFRGDFYCPDQRAERQPTAVTYDGTTVKLITMAGYGMFEGQLTNGISEMAGHWIQAGVSMSTTLTQANYSDYQVRDTK